MVTETALPDLQQQLTDVQNRLADAHTQRRTSEGKDAEALAAWKANHGFLERRPEPVTPLLDQKIVVLSEKYGRLERAVLELAERERQEREAARGSDVDRAAKDAEDALGRYRAAWEQAYAAYREMLSLKRQLYRVAGREMRSGRHLDPENLREMLQKEESRAVFRLKDVR